MKSARFPVGTDSAGIRERLLRFASGFENCAFLDSHPASGTVIPVTGIKYDLLVAAGSVQYFDANEKCLSQLQEFVDHAAQSGSWIFGHLSYDLKNEIEQLQSVHPEMIGFPIVSFFVPEHLFVVHDGEITVHTESGDAQSLWESVLKMAETPVEDEMAFTLQPRMEKSEYIHAVEKALHHIHRGDIYEMNLCHEYFAVDVEVEPVHIARKLFTVSPNPFSCYYRNGASHLVCASPERFIKRENNTLISQPIKGTAPRGETEELDRALLNELAIDPKERSENVMIVDLVRNDLSRVAMRGSVKVDELFGVYTFTGAHQMISTVSCSVAPEVSFTDIIRATFPMGSMTGAPKIRAMQIIEQLEKSRRGLFSGAVGYIEPNSNFDLNVVIRNIQYNKETRYLSVMAGGAITAGSIPEKEYRETLVKLGPQFKALGTLQPAEHPVAHD